MAGTLKAITPLDQKDGVGIENKHRKKMCKACKDQLKSQDKQGVAGMFPTFYVNFSIPKCAACWKKIIRKRMREKLGIMI